MPQIAPDAMVSTEGPADMTGYLENLFRIFGKPKRTENIELPAARSEMDPRLASGQAMEMLKPAAAPFTALQNVFNGIR